MASEKEIKELEKNQRLSARAIPYHMFFLFASAVTLWTLNKFFTISIWVSAIVIGITAFTFIGDIYNYFYCGRRVRKLKRQHDA